MDRGLAAVDRHRPVARIVMQERAAAGELVLHVGEPAAGAAGIDVVAPAHGQSHAVALRHDDAGRDDLDVELIDPAGFERLLLVVGVIGAERQGELLVELAMRGAQPALSDRGMRVERPLEHDFLHVGREHPQHQEDVGILGRG